MKRGARVLLALAAMGAAAVVATGAFALQTHPEVRSHANGVASRLPLPEPRIQVPRGAEVNVKLASALSTRGSEIGDTFEARLEVPLRIAGESVIPAGARVQGRLIRIQTPDEKGRPGILRLGFERLEYEGRDYALRGTSQLSGSWTLEEREGWSPEHLSLPTGHEVTFRLAHAIFVHVPQAS